MQTQLINWITLNITRGLGYRTINKLLEYFDSASAIVAAARRQELNHVLKPAIVEQLTSPDQAQIDATLHWLEGPLHHLITIKDDDYPSPLASSPDLPPLLYICGQKTALQRTQIAIVGSRHPTNQGAQIARDFAAELGANGLAVTSGLALGIDAAAHEGALKTPQSTIAVTATGADIIYPNRHQKLASAIVENGAIVTEFPLGTPPSRGNFPARNRIISGLSEGVLVVEANIKSGSLITAQHALDQNKDVFAIPGSIHNPLTKGCHSLIQNGAKLVTSTADIFNEILPNYRQPPMNFKKIEKKFSSPSTLDTQKQLLDFIEYTPISTDELVKLSGLTTETVCSMLLILEIEGNIIAEPGGFFTRTK